MAYTENLVLSISSDTSNAVKGIQQLNAAMENLTSLLVEIGRGANKFLSSINMDPLVENIDRFDIAAQRANRNIGESRFANTYASVENQINSLAGSTVALGKTGVDSFTNFSKSISQSAQGLNGLNGQITQLIGVLGFGTILEESLNASKIRESNKMFLSLNVDDSEVTSAYNKIQDLVVRLPGNDMFLTSILTLSKSQQPSMSDEDLEMLGTATAEYYAAANAKGQFTYETEKELRGYLLSGNTLAFKNSMISQYIDLLKDQNTIVDRARALEEALTKSGFAGMATMDSYANIFERFKGRIEKGFADIGDVFLGFVKGFLEVYNIIDALTMSGLTDVLLGLGLGIGVISASSMTLGFGIQAIQYGFEGIKDGINIFNSLSKSIDNNLIKTDSMKSKFSKIMDTMIASFSGEDALIQSRVKLTSLDLDDLDDINILDKVGMNKDDVLIYQNTLKELANLDKITGGADFKDVALISVLEGKNIDNIDFSFLNKPINEADRKLVSMLDKLKGQGTEGYLQAIWNSDAFESKDEKIEAVNAFQQMLETRAIQENTIAHVENEGVRKLGLTTKLQELKVKIANTWQNLKEADTEVLLAGVKSGNSDINIFNTITERLNAFAKERNAAASSLEAKSIVRTIILKSRETLVNIKNIITSNLKAAKNLILATTQAILNSQLTITTILMGILESEILVVVIAVLAVVAVFEKLGEALGFWDGFDTMFKSIADGIGRLWEAFKNSSIVQGISKLFETLSYFIGEVVRILGVFFGDIFGANSGGSLDPIQGIINVFGALSDIVVTVWENIRQVIGVLGIVVFAINPVLGVIMMAAGFIEDIAYWMEVFEAAWNQFIDSDEYKDVMNSLSEAGLELQKAFQPLWDSLVEIGKALYEAFGGDDVSNANDDINMLVEALKWIGNFIKVVIVPLVEYTAKLVAFIVKASAIYQIGQWLKNNRKTTTPSNTYHTTPNLVSSYNTTQMLTKSSKDLHDNSITVTNNTYVQEGAIQNTTSMTNQEVEKQTNDIMRKNWMNGYTFIGNGHRTI